MVYTLGSWQLLLPRVYLGHRLIERNRVFIPGDQRRECGLTITDIFEVFELLKQPFPGGH